MTPKNASKSQPAKRSLGRGSDRLLLHCHEGRDPALCGLASNTILDALASQPPGETSLTVRIAPDLIEEAMNVPGYRKLFAPVIAGVTEMAPIHAAYEQMREPDETNRALLVLVECQEIGEFREALGRLTIRSSSVWRAFAAIR